MKNVYIMGAGQFGKYIYNQLLEYKEDWRVLGYIDSDISKKDTQEAGVRIYHLWESDINDIDDNTVVFIAITRAGDKLRLVHRLIWVSAIFLRYITVCLLIRKVFYQSRVYCQMPLKNIKRDWIIEYYLFSDIWKHM